MKNLNYKIQSLMFLNIKDICHNKIRDLNIKHISDNKFRGEYIHFIADYGLITRIQIDVNQNCWFNFSNKVVVLFVGKSEIKWYKYEYLKYRKINK